MRIPALALGLCLPATTAMAAGFTVTSENIHNGGRVPMAQVLDRLGCIGKNISPQLSWSGEPARTRSFAITMYDPDAPTVHGWWHWIVFDIPARVHSLPENAGGANAARLPAGAVEGRNDFGFPHYGGPCPPAGDRPHRYVITVYALKVARLPPNARESGADLVSSLRSDAIASTQLIGHYGRQH